MRNITFEKDYTPQWMSYNLGSQFNIDHQHRVVWAKECYSILS